jgi:hypothetical protein
MRVGVRVSRSLAQLRIVSTEFRSVGILNYSVT